MHELENEINISALDSTENITVNSIIEELESRSLTEVLMTLPPQERRLGHCITLYFAGMRDPIELWGHTDITIGRRDTRRKIHPTIDLTEQHGAKLGVSRIHAQIIYKDSAYYVIDLGSKNFTWLNNRQLMAGKKALITHRDSLRLGHFIIQVGACQYA